jgi:hypothetical protein
VTDRNSACHVNGIQGLLIKKHYPGLVTIGGKEIVPDKWEHFYQVKDVHDEILAVKIKREF